MKGRKRILSAIICVAMILTLFSGVAMAQGGEPTVTLDMPQTFNVGEPVEFSISTTGGDKAGTMVLGTADWDGAAAVEKLEYKEGDSWMELKGDHFGPASGFPLGDFTSEFRVTFKEAGTFSLTVKIVEATNPDNVLTQTSSTIRSIVAPTVTVNAPESFAVGEAAEFTVTTTPGDLQGTMVLGRFTYDESKVEKLEYLESKDNKWYELTGNSFGPPATGFPLMEATSKFRVTFKEAGDVSFKIDIVPFSGGNALASAEDTFLSVAPTPEEVTVTPEVVSGNAEISGDTILLTENTPATIAFIPDGDLDIIEYQYSAAYPADADIEDVTDWLTADYLVPTYAFGSLAAGTYDFTLTLTENTNYETVFQKVYQIKVEEAAPATEDVY